MIMFYLIKTTIYLGYRKRISSHSDYFQILSIVTKSHQSENSECPSTRTRTPNNYTHLHDVRIEVVLGAHSGAVHQRPVLGLGDHIEQLFLRDWEGNAAGQLRHGDRLCCTGHDLDGDNTVRLERVGGIVDTSVHVCGALVQLDS